jgi:hypothetical protein
VNVWDLFAVVSLWRGPPYIVPRRKKKLGKASAVSFQLTVKVAEAELLPSLALTVYLPFARLGTLYDVLKAPSELDVVVATTFPLNLTVMVV